MKKIARYDIDVASNINSADILIVFGSDNTVLKALHKLGFKYKVLGISLGSSAGFLTETTIENMDIVFEKIEGGRYRIEKCNVIKAIIDDEKTYRAVNDIAIFPYKSATLMEYELWVDEEFIWRDHADGLIIATPLGSTAYSMSAGGPIILSKTNVFALTPVNSLDPSRRPLIIPSESIIELMNIKSRVSVEAVIDGIDRIKVNESISISKNSSIISFIKIEGISPIHSRLYRKVKLAEELIEMPPSAKLVFKVLEYEGPLTQKDIVEKTLLSPRTVRYALNILGKRGLIKDIPNLRDVRQKLYYTNI